MQLSKILLPTDFSERSAAAALYAKALACHFQSSLTIAHVFELSEDIAEMTETGIPPEWYDEREEEARGELAEFQAGLFGGITVRRKLLEGNVARAIVNYAHSEHMDLTVMPTHGYGPFRRFIVGSVTAKVLHDADCPVLTGVHLAEAPIPDPILFRNVVCAIDFDSAGERALRWAADFAAEFDARLTLVHALPRADVGQMHYFDQNFPTMLRKVAQEKADEFLARAGARAEVMLQPGSVSEVVHNAAADQPADLVVIGRHDSPGLLGRLRANAYAIVRESPCPVVSV